MGVTLFGHNQAAYEAAVSQMKTFGKAAVIHPTGTGKSFLAFKLCADHPGDKVCWLSPSEHIFATQKENWQKAGGEELFNITFLTYARLMMLGEEEMKEIRPSYIILDEFHRCGAKMWGQGVQRLLMCCPHVPLLGLSATNIRYLDNQRDMADELFDGSVASEMTLGEAIVRGILYPPKYVLSVFSYQKELQQYEAQVRAAKGKAAREAAGKALEALRRALERAEGMEEVFRKNMPDPRGKYIVFCAGKSHMEEMMRKVPEWFGKVDASPHVYGVYSQDPEAEQSFRAFKEDESGHLKLLFCIDMLNEGIHVEGVSGVILLRPTVSPVVYKQQIGRALSASRKKEAVVFDVVLNVENLCSISALEEEMEEALKRFRLQGKEERIVFPRFQVVDEAKDCIRLFQALEGTLSASWEMMYACAEEYAKEKGNLEVPKRYRTAKGYSLGQWLDTQRRVYAKKAAGRLTPEQVIRLEKIGMRWEGGWEASWERNLSCARRYYKEHGHLLVGAREEAYGVALGRWICQLRVAKKKEEGVEGLSPERIQKLEEIGMVWDVPAYQWERNYASAKRYYQRNGNLDVPSAYIDEEGISLGAWVRKMRRVGQNSALSQEQIRRLNLIGMKWEPKREETWEKSFAAAWDYQKEYGSLEIPVSFTARDGCRLGKWVRRQREAYQAGALSRERVQKLEEIGMNWQAQDGRSKKWM